MFTVNKTFSFSAAHHLENYDGKCAKLHGHNYKVIVRVKSKELDEQGMVIDFNELGEIVAPVISELDHTTLNDVLDANPTAENIAKHIYDAVKARLSNLYEIEVWETEKCAAVYNEK